MIATVEKLDGSYVQMEMGEPKCGEDFCDKCGDCLACYYDDGCFEDDNVGGNHRWVIYLQDEKNPFSNKSLKNNEKDNQTL